MIVKFLVRQALGNTSMFVTGNSPSLGAWNPHKASKFIDYTGDDTMVVSVEINDKEDAINFQYKFLMQHSHENLEWEKAENRTVDLEEYYRLAISLGKENIQLTITLQDQGFNQKS